MFETDTNLIDESYHKDRVLNITLLVFLGICSVLICHQQMTLWHLPHSSSILELFVLNSIASKFGFPELQMHSLVVVSV